MSCQEPEAVWVVESAKRDRHSYGGYVVALQVSGAGFSLDEGDLLAPEAPAEGSPFRHQLWRVVGVENSDVRYGGKVACLLPLTGTDPLEAGAVLEPVERPAPGERAP